jgi:hypothetical protein
VTSVPVTHWDETATLVRALIDWLDGPSMPFPLTPLPAVSTTQ